MRTRDYLSALLERHISAGTMEPEDLVGVEFVTNVTRLAARLVQDFERTHRPHNISWAGFRILGVLWVLGDSEPTQIARLAGASRASVSSALSTLERANLVERHHDSDDRRVVRVSVTREGQDLWYAAIQRQTERERAWTSLLTKAELETLMRLVRKLVMKPTPA